MITIWFSWTRRVYSKNDDWYYNGELICYVLQCLFVFSHYAINSVSTEREYTEPYLEIKSLSYDIAQERQ